RLRCSKGFGKSNQVHPRGPVLALPMPPLGVAPRGFFDRSDADTLAWINPPEPGQFIQRLHFPGKVDQIIYYLLRLTHQALKLSRDRILLGVGCEPDNPGSEDDPAKHGPHVGSLLSDV